MIKLNVKIEDYQSAKIKAKPKVNSYVFSEELRYAVEVAIKLGQPLLLTGEPGTGKTQLAYAIANQLYEENKGSFYPNPLVFNAKTTSTARDLFYNYDAISHFYDANIKNNGENHTPEVEKYIKLNALGKAIALTNAFEVEQGKFLDEEDKLEGKTRSSVVLIDEIDKAPRDFPNDILNEIEYFTFQIPEANNHKISKGNHNGIITILTSNSEKNLPDAFLRRCVFYHIPFPDSSQLIEIVKSQLEYYQKINEVSINSLISHFTALRENVRKKKPATAELIAWLRILELENCITAEKIDFNSLTETQKKILQYSYSVLAKSTEDLELLKRSIK